MLTQEQKQQISETLKTKYQTGEVIHPRLGKPVSQETRDKISKTLTGRKNRPRTDEEKRKISENNKANTKNKHNKQKIKLKTILTK